ncbi:hypothetical protein BC831DRAFT_266631 [Entophlyctis helioformis]|nr:hypothetical protein BC831DRAFT_266631 [Entophlyctis helioformis]
MSDKGGQRDMNDNQSTYCTLVVKVLVADQNALGALLSTESGMNRAGRKGTAALRLKSASGRDNERGLGAVGVDLGIGHSHAPAGDGVVEEPIGVDGRRHKRGAKVVDGERSALDRRAVGTLESDKRAKVWGVVGSRRSKREGQATSSTRASACNMHERCMNGQKARGCTYDADAWGCCDPDKVLGAGKRGERGKSNGENVHGGQERACIVYAVERLV